MTAPTLTRLGPGRGRTHADEVASLGLHVGDVIVGEESHPHSAVRLSVLFIGRGAVVYGIQRQSSHLPGQWIDDGDTAAFTLSCRDWHREERGA